METLTMKSVWLEATKQKRQNNKVPINTACIESRCNKQDRGLNSFGIAKKIQKFMTKQQKKKKDKKATIE